MLIFPRTGLAKIYNFLDKGWKLVRGIKTVTTIGYLMPIGNAPSLSRVSKSEIDEVIEDTKETTKKIGKARNLEKEGGYDKALEGFDKLNPVETKEISTKYGDGKVGTLKDGTTISIRPGSETGGLLWKLEFQEIE